MSKKTHFFQEFWPIIGICAFVFASCGENTSRSKRDVVPPNDGGSPDAQVIVVYVTPDAATQSEATTCTCVCAAPCICSCDCGTGQPVDVQVPGCIPPGNDGAAPLPPQEDAAPPTTDTLVVPIVVDAATRDTPVVVKDASVLSGVAADSLSDAVGTQSWNSDGSSDQQTDASLPDSGSDLTCPIYVDGNAIDAGIETGAPTSPWSTIQAAINNPGTCDTIIVKRGTYHDPISCQQYSFNGTIKSEEGANVTIIDRGNSTDEPYGIMLNDCSITVEGFTIANTAGTAIEVYSVPETTIIQHNIFLHNTQGIIVVFGPGDGSPIIIRNNIIIGDPNAITGPYVGTGIHLAQSGGLRRVENNLIIDNRGTSSTSAGVFIDNWSSGYVQNNIIADGYNGILRFYDYNTTISQYNCLFGNSYNYVSYEVAGTGDVHTDPMFVGSVDGGVGATTDFHLSPNSPCRNAGNPDPSFNNPDGTRNDIGPYGGPFGTW
jgi:hypothetical protein